MEELVELFEQMLLKLDDISDTLRDISGKLNNIDGGYSLDDIALNFVDITTAIDQATREIVASTGYNQTDIHGAISSIESTIELKD